MLLNGMIFVSAGMRINNVPAEMMVQQQMLTEMLLHAKSPRDGWGINCFQWEILGEVFNVYHVMPPRGPTA